jgi:serine/threonine-protein kinase
MLRLWNIAPDQMAAHFNITGNPDRFVSKAEFFWFQIQTMLIVLLVSIPPQVLFLFLPANLINMPNRDYWLAPERRAKTIDTLNSFGAMLFGVILLVIQAAFEISVYANLQTPIFFNARLMSTIMIISLIVIGLLLIQLVVSFRLPESPL